MPDPTPPDDSPSKPRPKKQPAKPAGSPADPPALSAPPSASLEDRAAAAARSKIEDYSRSLPFSHEAERAVLRSMLHLPDTLVGRAVEELNEHSFYNPAHRTLFSTMIDLFREGKAIDPILLHETLANRKLLPQIGGSQTLADLLTYPSSATHYAHYAKVIREKATLRRIISTCSESIDRAFEDQEDIPSLVDHVEQGVLSIRQEMERGSDVLTMERHVELAIDEIEQIIANPNSIRGVPTGFSRLDKLTHGLHGGDIFIVAARPSMGKTSFGMNIVEHVAVDRKTATAVFSLEMSAKMLVRRLIVCRAQLSMSKLMGGLLNRAEHDRIALAAQELQNSKIIIDDTPGLSILELRAKARRFKKDDGIGLIVVDYLQLLTSSSRRASDNRQIEISEISAGLKAIAKELDVPVICLAQLNRQVEQRKGARPMLSDLRESGSIEQDADVVGLLTRNNYAGSAKADEEKDQSNPEEEGNSVLIIAKHRNGATGDIPLRFIGESMRFVERDPTAGETDAAG